MLELGLIQGRLTPSRGRGIQFPLLERAEWEREFELAPQAGISCIEWVADARSPLLDPTARQELKGVMARTGVRVRNMDLHELLTKTDVVQHADELFEALCSAMQDIGGGTIEMPFVEASSLLGAGAYEGRVAALRRFLAVAKKYGVPVAVETDLPPRALAAFAQGVPEAGIVWDAGNSAGLGYDMQEELALYGSRITNVHIKDKPVGGATVPLGQGSVDFVKLFAELKAIAYTGAVTLQAARGEDGKEVETISNYARVIQDAYEKSL